MALMLMLVGWVIIFFARPHIAVVFILAVVISIAATAMNLAPATSMSIWDDAGQAAGHSAVFLVPGLIIWSMRRPKKIEAGKSANPGVESS
ncbi:MAG: hypothetical protein HY054_02375 [Proteobacteria bacterium]|nr:hypothetical protein [Pseudomonadota bacterium]